MIVLALLVFTAAASNGNPSGDLKEESELNALHAELANLKMNLAQVRSADEVADAKQQTGAVSRQADLTSTYIEDAVRKIVSKEIKNHQDNNVDQQILHLQAQIDKLRCLIKKSSDFVTPVVLDGTAGASSQYSSSYPAQNAFNSENSDDRWCSTNAHPAKLWFNFTSPVKVVKISFSSITSTYWKESPKIFKVIASNDCSNWHTLLSVANSGFTGGDQVKSWPIPCTQQKSYKCFGIESTENHGYHSYTSLKKMKMFQ